MGRNRGHFCTVLWMRDLLKEIWELGADVRGGGVRKGVPGYPCTPLLTLDTLSFSYLILDIPLIMLWGKTQLYRKECSRTPVDRLFDGMLLPFTIVVKFVVAGKRNQTSETNTEWEKNLWCSIDPNLKYNKNSVYVKKGNMTVLLCKVCNHVTRRPCWYSREWLDTLHVDASLLKTEKKISILKNTGYVLTGPKCIFSRKNYMKKRSSEGKKCFCSLQLKWPPWCHAQTSSYVSKKCTLFESQCI